MTECPAQMPDLRCSDCVSIGCECPQGYEAPKCRCDTCGAVYVVAFAACVELVLRCPACGGTLSRVDED